MEFAIQKSPQGYRLVAVIPFTDEEGNQAFEIHGVHNRAEVEWYPDLDDVMADLCETILTPAPWTVRTTIYYEMLGPPLPGHNPTIRNIAYKLKDNNEIREAFNAAAQAVNE